MHRIIEFWGVAKRSNKIQWIGSCPVGRAPSGGARAGPWWTHHVCRSSSRVSSSFYDGACDRRQSQPRRRPRSAGRQGEACRQTPDSSSSSRTRFRRPRLSPSYFSSDDLPPWLPNALLSSLSPRRSSLSFLRNCRLVPSRTHRDLRGELPPENTEPSLELFMLELSTQKNYFITQRDKKKGSFNYRTPGVLCKSTMLCDTF